MDLMEHLSFVDNVGSGRTELMMDLGLVLAEKGACQECLGRGDTLPQQLAPEDSLAFALAYNLSVTETDCCVASSQESCRLLRLLPIPPHSFCHFACIMVLTEKALLVSLPN